MATHIFCWDKDASGYPDDLDDYLAGWTDTLGCKVTAADCPFGCHRHTHIETDCEVIAVWLTLAAP